MEKQEEYLMPNRAEYIRLARESCSRNQSGNVNNKAKNAYRHKEMFIQDDVGYVMEENDIKAGQNTGMKIFLVRLICASLLFLMIFLMDQFDFKFKQVNTSMIENQISASMGVKEAQDFFVSVLDKFK